MCDIDRGTEYSKCIECGLVSAKNNDSNLIYCKSCYRTYCFVCHEVHSDYSYCPNEDTTGIN